MKPKLWTRNFTILTLGSLISAMGEAAMSLALSLVVFDETASTWLSGLYGAVSMVPHLLLPLLLAPLIDRCNRKGIIVTLDYTMGCLYLLFLLYVSRAGFRYGAYLLFSFLCNCIGSVYGLTYSSWYPDLIPAGAEQRGYAVSSMIYPLTMTLVTPIAALVYSRWGVESLFLAEGVLLLTAGSFEACIYWNPGPLEKPAGEPLRQRIRRYVSEATESLRYLKKEPGLRNIYLYMMVTNGAGTANSSMTLAHFQSANVLTTAMYSTLISAETIGRLAGSMVHYVFQIPQNRRYWLTVRVYLIYELFDGILLFVAYPLMLVMRFLCGFLGVNTATLRTAAVQSYLPQNLRARVNGLFNVLASLGVMGVQLIAGALGEWIPYRLVALGMAAVTSLCVFLLIVRNREAVRKIYEYEAQDR